MVVLMTPEMANFSGKVHGGALLAELDRVAYCCASRFSKQYAVTLSVEVNYAGRTSMEIGIRVEAEEVRSGARRHTNSCYFTMVAVDAEGRPTAVPQYRPRTHIEVRRHRAAQMRRELRREFEARFEAVADGE
jgi:acyl-CoA hydrolase